MRLARRTPRAGYRVYDEDEYIAGEVGPRELEPVEGRSSEHGLRIVAGLVLVVGASGALLGLIAFGGAQRRRAVEHPRASGASPRERVPMEIAAPTTRAWGWSARRAAGGHRRRPSHARSLRSAEMPGARVDRGSAAAAASPVTSAPRVVPVAVVPESGAEFGFERWAR
jgi:hypothetical protein